MLRVRLKAIVYQCDFRKSDRTLFADFAASRECPGELGANEAFLFVSGSERQLIWWFRSTTVDVHGKSITATHAYRTRLDCHSPWNPLMLQEYASRVGIELQGIRSFEAAFKEQREYMRRRRIELAKARE